MTEYWKEIRPGYLVSNWGNVDSILSGERVRLKPWADEHGYLCVKLVVDGQRKTFRVHRLVAEAFLPMPYSYEWQVDHLDGNRQNNRADNLEWVKPRENSLRRLEREKGMKRNRLHSSRFPKKK